MSRRRAVLSLTVMTLVLAAMALASCSDGGGGEAAGAEGKLDRVIEIDGERGLYVRCTGAGSPTVVMEAGDESDSYQYNNVEWQVSQKTRTCVYDRAGLGKSDPAPPPPRQLPDLVGDLDKLLDAAEIPGPYVLVGASGGLVFATESGTLINPSNLRNRSFKPLLKHARLPDHLLS